MTKSPNTVEKEAKAQAEQEPAAEQPPVSPSPNVADVPPEVLPPQIDPPAVAAARERKSGIPSADEIRAQQVPENEESAFENWQEQTRNMLGQYLSENAALLNGGTELEFAYRTNDGAAKQLWMNHYLTFQHDLQQAGYQVFMIGGAHDPKLRIKLGAPRQTLGETRK